METTEKFPSAIKQLTRVAGFEVPGDRHQAEQVQPYPERLHARRQTSQKLRAVPVIAKDRPSSLK